MQRAAAAFVLLLGSVAFPAAASSTTANPIRKVVTMLKNMQTGVEAEGEKEKAAFDKYMCWCKSNAASLGKSIADANVKAPALQSDIGKSEGSMAALKEEVAKAQTDRAAAEAAMKEATGIREKEASEFSAEKDKLTSYVTALNGAIAALEKGMGASFLQSDKAGVLKRMVAAKPNMLDADRQDVLSFLSQGQGGAYAPASGEITGILKTMVDEFSADLGNAEKGEAEAGKAYNGLMAAKTKEVKTLTKMVEEKLTRIASLGVEIASMKNDLTDTEEALGEDTKFLADTESNCASRRKDWAQVCATRGDEVLAIQDTIKFLNSDEALELFKKTLPSASLLQLKVTEAKTRARALEVVRAARPAGRWQLDFIALALRGKQHGFEKVVNEIDKMVASLKAEQGDDEQKKEFCDVQFDVTEDKVKELGHTISDLETGIAKDQDAITATTAEIDALEDGIRALDKAVAEATGDRKQEHEDYTNLMAGDSTAKELILFAKNRLNKFYNPTLYQPPPKRELSEEDQITLSMGGTLAPTLAPGGIAGTGIGLIAYTKSQGSGGVIAMIDMIVKDLDKEMTEATATEKDAQADYEAFMADSANKRAEDSKTLADREGSLADLQAELHSLKDSMAGATKELGATNQYKSSLHAECDWLLKYFEQRQAARTSEIEALGNAKAVLSGADYSLIETAATSSARKMLRGQ